MFSISWPPAKILFTVELIAPSLTVFCKVMYIVASHRPSAIGSNEIVVAYDFGNIMIESPTFWDRFHRLTTKKGVHQFRFFLSPMRTPRWRRILERLILGTLSLIMIFI